MHASASLNDDIHLEKRYLVFVAGRQQELMDNCQTEMCV
jgi:UDP-N-acetylglucosamine transferase subunit ALG13